MQTTFYTSVIQVWKGLIDETNGKAANTNGQECHMYFTETPYVL